MMRSIRINDSVYQTLRALQRPRESYGDVIERVITELIDRVGVQYLSRGTSFDLTPPPIDTHGQPGGQGA